VAALIKEREDGERGRGAIILNISIKGEMND